MRTDDLACAPHARRDPKPLRAERRMALRG